MPVNTLDIIHIVIALTIILFFSHSIGYLFQVYNQPRAIGEILAGIVMGPTLFQHFCPNAFSFIFSSPVTNTLLNILYQLGLLHLMFRTGMEMQAKLKKNDKLAKVAAWIAGAGMAIPFGASFIWIQFIDIHKYIGSANSKSAFVICFSIAVAISSIPVIARILHDLKILNTSFSK